MNQLFIELQIKMRKWTWKGHTLRRPETTIVNQALARNSQRQRWRWRPKSQQNRKENNKTTMMFWVQLQPAQRISTSFIVDQWEAWGCCLFDIYTIPNLVKRIGIRLTHSPRTEENGKPGHSRPMLWKGWKG